MGIHFFSSLVRKRYIMRLFILSLALFICIHFSLQDSEESAETILGEYETSEEEDELVSEYHLDFSTQLVELISWTKEICTIDTCNDIVNNFNFENEDYNLCAVICWDAWWYAFCTEYPNCNDIFSARAAYDDAMERKARGGHHGKKTLKLYNSGKYLYFNLV